MSRKVALVGDLHLGVRASSSHFMSFQHEWLMWMFNKCRDMGIKRIVFSGDMFDVRKALHGKLYDYLVTKLIPEMQSFVAEGGEIVSITGNHDITLRESNRISWVQMLSELSGGALKAYREADTHTFSNGDEMAMVPWINDENVNSTHDYILSTQAKYAIGHLELAGFPMYNGVPSEHGMSPELFSRFDIMFTGHYHTKSHMRNIMYVGAPYHLTWADFVDGNNRGFTVLDYETGKVEDVLNEPFMTLFSMMQYDPKADYGKPELLEPYRGTIMKVIVDEAGTPAHMKKFLTALNGLDLIDFTVINNTIMKEAQAVEVVKLSEADLTLKTSEVVSSYIDGQELIHNPSRLKQLAHDVYRRALETV